MRFRFGKERFGALVRRGDTANASRCWAEAEAAYRKALELNPQVANIWVQYGHALKEQGRLRDAEQAYWRSISIEREADSFLQLGHVLKLQSRFEEAKLAYATARAMDPALSDAADGVAQLETPDQPPFRAPHLVRVPFDAAAYAKTFGIAVDDALIHYVSGGFRHYGSRAGAAAAVAYLDLETRHIDDHYRDIYKDNFDPLFYWDRFPDVWSSGANPLDHFHFFGWCEGYDPSPIFSVEHYLTAYPDVRQAGIDPFVHHLLFGRLLGRTTARSSAEQPPRRSPGRAKMPLDRTAQPISQAQLQDFSPAAAPLAPPPGSFAVDALDIHVVVPDFAAGSGGHMTVFRICNQLEAKGHRVTVWILEPGGHKTPETVRDLLHRHYQHLQNPVRFVNGDIVAAQGDIILATDRRTVPIVTALTGFKRRFYLVQDIEPAVLPAGDSSLLAEPAHHGGLDCICAGPWLEQVMGARYGLWARKFWQAVDTSVYRDSEPAKSGHGLPRIAFCARMSAERQAVEIGLRALEILARRGIKFHVDFFGQNEPPLPSAAYSATQHGVLDQWALAQLYNRAVVGVALSAASHSIVPQEMMACGLAVVDIDTERTRALYADVARLAGPEPETIADAIELLLSDTAARAAQAQRAKKWVSQFTWERSADLVEAAFIERLSELSFQPSKPAIRKKKPFFATVVIPTYNGGALLHRVIESVRNQRTPEEVQLLCIDSSSTDGTNEHLRDHPDVELVTIRQKDFQHGRTRNFAVELAKSEFVAFLTQDALPTNATWLYNLVCVLKAYPEAGAVFGRQIAHENASVFVKIDTQRHFAQFDGVPNQFDGVPVCVDPDDEWIRERWPDPAYRKFFHFHSDNNSCLRKSIWQTVPIPCLEYGEDQAFAYELLQHGYGVAYARNAAVFHSHDDPPAVIEQRVYQEATFYYRQFGYRFASSELEALGNLHRQNLIDEERAREHEIDAASLDLRIARNRAAVDGGLRAMRDAGVLPAPPACSPGLPQTAESPAILVKQSAELFADP